mmetsp:Transcript_31585/g.58235  ORF Transcript_31585/g.58235 Transcript_31585/m.58235 type:complete len:220 (+) Transcript_31585:2952-3611(+)
MPWGKVLRLSPSRPHRWASSSICHTHGCAQAQSPIAVGFWRDVPSVAAKVAWSKANIRCWRPWPKPCAVSPQFASRTSDSDSRRSRNTEVLNAAQLSLRECTAPSHMQSPERKRTWPPVAPSALTSKTSEEAPCSASPAARTHSQVPCQDAPPPARGWARRQLRSWKLPGCCHKALSSRRITLESQRRSRLDNPPCVVSTLISQLCRLCRAARRWSWRR